MLVSFSWTIPPEACINPQQVLTILNSLVPSNRPADLNLSCLHGTGLTIAYSLTLATEQDAAQAIVNALKKVMPE